MQPITCDACCQPPLAPGVESTGLWSAVTGSSASDDGRGVTLQLLAEAWRCAPP